MSREEDVNRAAAMLIEASDILKRAIESSRDSCQSTSTSRNGTHRTEANLIENDSGTGNYSDAPNLMRTAVGRERVLSEVRRSFAPYQTPSRSNRNGRQLLRASSGSRSMIGRLWTHRLFCLEGPDETLSPGTNRSADLFRIGLGQKPITINIDADADCFASEITKIYNKLEGHEFEILRACGGGSGKQLIKVIENKNIPTPREVSTVVRSSIVYVRPLTSLVPNNNNDEALRREITNSRETVLQNSQANDEDILNLNIPTTLLDTTEDLTLEEWRIKLYSDFNSNDSTCIFIQRDDLAHRVLGIYKREIDIYKKPDVIFAGEAGSDAGALTKEFFYCGIEALSIGKYNGRFPFFEGEKDFKLPSADSSLLRSGIFKLIGKFMLHSAIHTGIGFVGLSDCVVDFLMTEEVSHETPLEIKIEDLPDYELQTAVKNIDHWLNGLIPAQDEILNISKIAVDSGFNETINADCLKQLKEHILYHFVFEKRRGQLEALKSGFIDQRFYEFIHGKEYLFKGLFPKWKNFNFSAKLITSKIKCDDEESPIVLHVKQFISDYLDGHENVKQLLTAWTGFPEIPETGLKIKITEDDEFLVQTCFSEMIIPISYNKIDIYAKLDLLIKNCTGFGLI